LNVGFFSIICLAFDIKNRDDKLRYHAKFLVVKAS
jgi:hypothetical protein